MKDYKRDIAYWNKLKEKSWHKAQIKKRSEPTKTAQDLWFEKIMREEEPVCWNCGTIAEWLKKEDFRGVWRGCVAHIVPKRKEYGIPSVATHPLNYLILFPAYSKICACHDIYDSSWLTAIKMPVFPLAKERFKLFEKNIAEYERDKIPEVFLNDVMSFL